MGEAETVRGEGKRGRDERRVERAIPADSADYLNKRKVTYAKPIVVDGKPIDLNKPGPLSD